MRGIRVCIPGIFHGTGALHSLLFIYNLLDTRPGFSQVVLIEISLSWNNVLEESYTYFGKYGTEIYSERWD